MSPNSKIILLEGYLLRVYKDNSLNVGTKVHHGKISDSASETFSVEPFLFPTRGSQPQASNRPPPPETTHTHTKQIETQHQGRRGQ